MDVIMWFGARHIMCLLCCIQENSRILGINTLNIFLLYKDYWLIVMCVCLCPRSAITDSWQASTLTFVQLSGTSENWRRTSRSCITVVRRGKWKNDCPTFWRLFSMIKMCCFVIFTDLNFVNNYFNVFKNIGFHWSTLSLITTVNQDIFRTYTQDPYLFSDLIKRQLALSNYNEIDIDLFTVFPSPIQ